MFLEETGCKVEVEVDVNKSERLFFFVVNKQPIWISSNWKEGFEAFGEIPPY